MTPRIYLFERLKSERNNQIKDIIKRGLLELKPPRIKTNKEDWYWGEIEKYQIEKGIQ